MVGAENTENPVYECAGTKILGGYERFGKGASLSNYIKMDPHYKIRLNFTYYRYKKLIKILYFFLF